MTPGKELDAIDWQILELLQENARLPYAEIGRRVGLSLPAAAERVRRMEEACVIEGYRTRVNLDLVGLPVIVFIQVRVPSERYPQFKELVGNLNQIIECHHVTGEEAFILKAVLKSISQLEALVTQLSRFGQTTSSIVLSTCITERMISSETSS